MGANNKVRVREMAKCENGEMLCRSKQGEFGLIANEAVDLTHSGNECPPPKKRKTLLDGISDWGSQSSDESVMSSSDDDADNLEAPSEKLTPEAQALVLDSLDVDCDRHLQRLLFQAGFFFKLQAHQFAAVRFVAGAPTGWPARSVALKATALPAPRTRGAILADQM